MGDSAEVRLHWDAPESFSILWGVTPPSPKGPAPLLLQHN